MSDHGHAPEAHGHDAAPAADHGHAAPDAHAPAADHGAHGADHGAHGGGHETPAHGDAHGAEHGAAGNQLEATRNAIDAKRAEFEGKIQHTREKVHGILRFGEAGAPSKQKIWLEPFYAAGDVLDATAGTAGRRVWEIAETTGAAIKSTLNMAVNPILHPLNTLKHPLKYMANFGRIFTTSIENYANIFNAIPRSIQEIYERGIQRPASRLLGRVPLIGSGIEKLTSGLGWLVKQPRHLTEFISYPIYQLDDWMMHTQG